MKRLLRFLLGIPFVIFSIAVAESITKGNLHAQQGKKPTLTSIKVDAPLKLDESLAWISEYSQPFIYQVWWAEIAWCEGLPLPVEKARKVQFFQVNASEFVPEDINVIVLAITYGDVEQIFIANPFIWNRSLVEHEMLHLLLMWNGEKKWGKHPPVRFESCGLRISGPPPPNQ